MQICSQSACAHLNHCEQNVLYASRKHDPHRSVFLSATWPTTGSLVTIPKPHLPCITLFAEALVQHHLRSCSAPYPSPRHIETSQSPVSLGPRPSPCPHPSAPPLFFCYHPSRTSDPASNFPRKTANARGQDQLLQTWFDLRTPEAAKIAPLHTGMQTGSLYLELHLLYTAIDALEESGQGGRGKPSERFIAADI